MGFQKVQDIYSSVFILFLSALTFFIVPSILITQEANAETIPTSVTVGNTAPTFSVSPVENPTSDNTTPTDVGADVTWEATATDSNGEDYYLAICKTNAVTAVNGGAPTCDDGNWCITGSAQTEGDQHTCSYTVQASDTNETYDWYAFVCDDHASGSLCSSADQGSGNSGSPFSVNHPPTFNAISNNSPQDPGVNITWSTDASTLDTDTAGTSDTVKLLVCQTAGVTAGACDGTQLCASLFVASDPSCSYTIPIPTADTTYDGYVYLVDNHNLESSDANNGTNEQYTVNNVAPVVSNVTTNGGVAIDLSESTTQAATITADVTDNNGCGGGEIDTVTTSAYRSGVTYASCDTAPEEDYDDCYPLKSCSESSCTGAGATYTCTVNLQYHADPTDANTEYPLQNWLSTVVATDDDAASDNTEDGTGVEMNSLTAMDITASIDYGAKSIGTNSGNLLQTTTVTATGNVGLDNEVSGTDMSDGGTGTITVDYQHYAGSEVLYSAGTALTTSAVELELNVPKTKAVGTTTTPETDDIWWGIEIPVGTTSGTYTGTNTVTAVKGETVNW